MKRSANRTTAKFLILFLLVVIMFSLSVSLVELETQAEITPSTEPVDYRGIVNQINMNKVQSNVMELVGFNSRVTGYPGYEEAAQFIHDKFIEYNLTNVSYEYYDLAVPITYGANLTLPNDETIRAYPLWPNLIETCAISPEGVEGPLIYARDGDLSDYHDRVEGSIVLMDYNCRGNWLYAAQFGAKAVIFIESETTVNDAQQKVLTIPLDFPRLYVSKADGDYLLNLLSEGEFSVKIKNEMVYQNIKAKNVIGFIPGTALANETVVLSAYYDSMSVVPSLSPGAQEAIGIATLLELARFFSKLDQRPLRTIMFLALSGHNYALAGAREFVHKHFEEIGSKLKLLVNLDLNTGSNTIGIFYWGYYYAYNSPVGRYYVIETALFDKYLPEIEKQLDKKYNVENGILSDPGAISCYIDDPSFYLDSETFSLAGGLGFSFYTTHRSRTYRNTPYDTYDKINFENLKPQVEFIFCSLFSLINDDQVNLPELRPTSADVSKGGFATLKGQVIFYNYETAWYEPVPNAIIAAYILESEVLVGKLGLVYAPQIIIIADENGSFTIHGVPHGASPYPGVVRISVAGYVDTPTYGPIEYAPDYGKYGRVYASELEIDEAVDYVNVVVFKSGSIALLGIMNPKSIEPLTSPALEVRTFRTDKVPDFWGFSYDYTELGNNAMFYTELGENIEVTVKSGGEITPLSVLVNATSKDPEGLGFRIEYGTCPRINILQIVWDLYWLDEVRLQKCREWNIIGAKATNFHNEAWIRLQNALNALQKPDPDYEVFYTEIIAAWSLERSAYVETRNLMKGAINTIVFFFILLIPFAFLLERLLIESKNVIKRIASLAIIVGVFIGTFYFLHPGFHIASNVPMAISGFTLTVLTAPAILLLFSKITTTLKVIRARLLGAHFAEISRSSVFLSAFSIGIQNMKRRKFRTLLTLISIILMIFSLMSFTSLTALSVTRTQKIPGQTTYNGLLIVHPIAGYPLRENLVEYLEGAYDDIATITKRAYLYPAQSLYTASLGGRIRFLGPNGSSFEAYAIIGLSHLEPEVSGLHRALIQGTWFTEDSKNVCIISNLAAQKLNVNTGDTITYAGVKLTVIGIFDSTYYDNIKDLDQSIITPFSAYTGLQPTAPHTSSDAIVIFPYEFALSQGGVTYNIALKFKDPTAVFNTARKLATVFPALRIYAGANGEVSTFYKSEEVISLGWQLLVIPLVIAAMGIANMMLASIHERIPEIRTYSSVGLSPFHVSGMYIAEASIYAVLGAVIGYALGNLGSIILRTFEILPPDLIPNTSASWVIVAVAVSMAATMLATLYPMYKSGKLVTPSLERAWKIPTKPKGKEWVVPLPFYISREEADGVLAYMKEFFEAHATERAEAFWIRNLKYSEKREEETVLKTLKMTTRLQPYETGMEQESEIILISRTDEEHCPIELKLKLTTGISHMWEASNKKYVDSIRKQLLIWGSLRKQDREKYLKIASKELQEAH